MIDWIKQFFAKNWKQYTAYLVTILAGMALAWLTGNPFLPGPVPEPIFAQGWVENPDEVKVFSESLKFPVFADTPAGKQEIALPTFVYQWDTVKKAWGKPTPIKNQGQVGSCVGFGTTLAAFNTMAGNIAIGNANEELVDICEEVTYAGSRVDVGGGKLRGDGSVGAWAAKYITEVGGLVSRGIHGANDLSSYSESRCRAWGNSGAPADIKALAKEHHIRATTQIQNWEEAKKALAQGYGIAVSSNQGFTMKRDANGVCQPSGSWAHCMCLDGYTTQGGVEYGHIQNSWGPSAHTGPVGWGEPNTAGFWTKSSTVDHMLKAGDSWAFSGVNGFPARNPDWFLQAPRDNKVQLAQAWRKSCEQSFSLCP